MCDDSYKEPDYATGHAFIVFNYEKDKLRFLKKAREADASTAAKPMLPSVGFSAPRVLPNGSGSGKPPRQLLPTASEPGRPPQVIDAPEPSEVNWEALELDDNVEKRALFIG